MKNKILAIPLMAISLVTLTACEGSIASAVGGGWSGSMEEGNAISTTDSNPGDFTSISLLGPDNIIFTTDDDASIRAEGDAEVIERLRFELDGDKLKVGRVREKKWGGYDKSATIYISAPSLRAAKLAGSGNIRVDQLNGDEAAVSIAGSGDVVVDEIDTKSLKARISGSGDMKLAGKAKNVSANVTGSGELNGKGLSAETAELKVTGSGDVIMSSDGKVSAKVTGSGDIRVHGDAECTSKTTGSGEVKCS